MTSLWLFVIDVNVPTKSNKQRNLVKRLFLLASWRSLTKRARSVSHRYGSEDPDPYQNVTDPEGTLDFCLNTGTRNLSHFSATHFLMDTRKFETSFWELFNMYSTDIFSWTLTIIWAWQLQALCPGREQQHISMQSMANKKCMCLSVVPYVKSQIFCASLDK